MQNLTIYRQDKLQNNEVMIAEDFDDMNYIFIHFFSLFMIALIKRV